MTFCGACSITQYSLEKQKLILDLSRNWLPQTQISGKKKVIEHNLLWYMFHNSIFFRKTKINFRFVEKLAVSSTNFGKKKSYGT